MPLVKIGEIEVVRQNFEDTYEDESKDFQKGMRQVLDWLETIMTQQGLVAIPENKDTTTHQRH